METWTRNFGGHTLSSRLWCSDDGGLNEAFGPFVFRIDLQTIDKGLSLPLSGWRLGKIPLPAQLAPRSDAQEFEDESARFCFDIRLTLPVLGLMAHYKGWLLPAEQA